MKHTLTLSLLFAAGVAFCAPTPGYYYPSGMQAGTKIRMIVGGQAFGGVSHALVTGDGVKVTRIVKVPGFPRAVGRTQVPWVVDWAYDMVEGKKEHRIMPPEAVVSDTDWARNDWWEALDEHDPLEMQIVLRDRYTPENYPQATPALDHLLILDVEADATAKPGRRDIMLVDGRSASVPHSFFITSEPHVIEPFFTIPPREKFRAPLPGTLHWPNEFEPATLPVVFDGQAWPGETDVFSLKLKKGIRLTCKLTGRELLPYLGDAVPGFFNPVMRLRNSKGDEVAFADDFVYLPDPILSCIVPEDGTYILEVFDNLYRGRSDFVYFVQCYEDVPEGPLETARERAFACFPPPASHEPPDARQAGFDVRSGVVNLPGRAIRCDFKVTEPESLTFDLFARRMGSPLDGVLRLYGPVGKDQPLSAAPLLVEWDDAEKFLAGTIPQALCDAQGTWSFREPGDYCVTVSDRTGQGGEDFAYTLAISKTGPDVEVYAETSAYRLSPGGRVEIPVRLVRKNGFKGTVRFENNADFEFTDAEIPADKDKGFATASHIGKPWTGVLTSTFKASFETEPGRRRTVRVTPADPAEQAFAYTHLVPQRTFFFCNPERD